MLTYQAPVQASILMAVTRWRGHLQATLQINPLPLGSLLDIRRLNRDTFIHTRTQRHRHTHTEAHTLMQRLIGNTWKIPGGFINLWDKQVAVTKLISLHTINSLAQHIFFWRRYNSLFKTRPVTIFTSATSTGLFICKFLSLKYKKKMLDRSLN